MPRRICPIKSHILGVLLIRGVTELQISKAEDDNDLIEAVKIINKWLKEPISKKRLLDCQEEMIEAGYEEFAQP